MPMNENPSDVKLDETQNGTVTFASEVIATIAGLAANEVEGVAAMVNPSNGISDMFGRKQTKSPTKGIRIDLEGSDVTVDVTMVVEYGYPIPEVAGGIQENIRKAIETMAGLTVKTVNVHVTGISFENELRAARELDEQQKKMLQKAEEEEKAAREAAASATEEAAEAPVVEEIPEDEEPDDIDDEEELDEVEEDPIDEDEAEESTEEPSEKEDAE